MSEEEEQNRFSLRKLSIGLASVLVGVSIFGTSQTVKADTVANNQASSVTNNAQSSDTQENGNAVKSSFLGDNQTNNVKSNLIQTQVEAKKDQKHDSVPNTQEATDGNNLDAEKDIVRTSSLQEPDNQSNNHAEDNSQAQLQNSQKLNLTKNSPKFAKKVLATNLTQDNSTQNNDWADPAKQGLVKTSVGWVTPEQKNNSKLGFAEKSEITISNYYAKKDMPTNTYCNLNDNPRTVFSFHVKATINNKDLTPDKDIALGSIAMLQNEPDRLHIGVLGSHANANNNPIIDKTTGTILGNIHIESWNNKNILVLFHSNATQKYAKPVTLDYTMDYAWDTGDVDYSHMQGVTDQNMYKVRYVTPQDQAYEIDYGYKNATPTHFIDYHASPQNTIVAGGEWLLWDSNYGTYDLNDNTDHQYNRVIKITPKTVGAKVVNASGQLKNQSFYHVIDKSGKVLSTDIGIQTYNIWSQQSGNDLSAQQLFNETPDHACRYSLQSDGSVLISYKVHLSDFYTNRQTLTNFIKQTKWWNLENPSNKQEILQNTLDYYAKRNYMANGAEILSSFGFNTNNKATTVITSDLTPNSTNKAQTSISQYTPNGISGSTVDTSLYEPINVKFVDDTDPDNVLTPSIEYYASGTTPVIQLGGVSSDSQKSVISIPNNMILTDNQPDLQDWNFDSKTFNYGLVKVSGNHDIVIHMAHKIVTVDGNANLDGEPTIKKALNADATRTINITYPAGYQGNNPTQVVERIHFIRSAKVDLTTDTIDESSLTKWNPVASSAHGVTITNGETTFDAVKLPHINGYKAHLVRNKINPAMLMVSFVAVPTETKPSNPVEVAPSKPSANADNTNKPADDLKDLKQRVVTELNSNDSGWTMPTTADTHVIEVPTDSVSIDLSNLVIAEPVHAHTHTQIRVTKRFKLSKKHSIKHLKHRKKAVRQFKKYRL